MAIGYQIPSRFLAVFLLFLFLFLILQIAEDSSESAEKYSHGYGSRRSSDLKLNREEILGECGQVTKLNGNVIRTETEEVDGVDEESLVVTKGKEEPGRMESVVDAFLSCPARCFRLNPVCGVDGQTYWCGALDAKCSGVAVDYTGFCEIVSKGSIGGKAVESLLLVHMVWLILTALFLLFGTP